MKNYLVRLRFIHEVEVIAENEIEACEQAYRDADYSIDCIGQLESEDPEIITEWELNEDD